jgi:hypothetical protein
LVAFNWCQELSLERGMLVEHQELIKSAIRTKDMYLLTSIKTLSRRMGVPEIEMICDTMVCYLEMGMKEVAKIHSWYLILTEERLKRITERQAGLKNPEILHQIFVYFYENIKVSERFLDDFLRQITDLYGNYVAFWTHFRL